MRKSEAIFDLEKQVELAAADQSAAGARSAPGTPATPAARTPRAAASSKPLPSHPLKTRQQLSQKREDTRAAEEKAREALRRELAHLRQQLRGREEAGTRALDNLRKEHATEIDALRRRAHELEVRLEETRQARERCAEESATLHGKVKRAESQTATLETRVKMRDDELANLRQQLRTARRLNPHERPATAPTEPVARRTRRHDAENAARAPAPASPAEPPTPSDAPAVPRDPSSDDPNAKPKVVRSARRAIQAHQSRMAKPRCPAPFS